MNNALPIASPSVACLGCGAVNVELTHGYCDESQACHDAAVAIQLERESAMAECAERMWANGCVCGSHKEAA